LGGLLKALKGGWATVLRFGKKKKSEARSQEKGMEEGVAL